MAFPFWQPTWPLYPICSICAQRREGTQHRRLALELFFNHHREKRKHLSSCAHEGQVLSKSALALSNGKPLDLLHLFDLHSHARLETRSSGTVERSHMGTLPLRTTNTHRKPLQDRRSGFNRLLHGIRPFQDCRFGFYLSLAQHRGQQGVRETM